MELKSYHFFIILLILFVFYQMTQREYLNNAQLVHMKRVDLNNALADHANNASRELEIAKVMAKNDDVNCHIAVNETAFNDHILCDGKYSPIIEEDVCQNLGKEFNQPSRNKMQNTKCVMGNLEIY
jgi:hypothetical protein